MKLQRRNQQAIRQWRGGLPDLPISLFLILLGCAYFLPSPTGQGMDPANAPQSSRPGSSRSPDEGSGLRACRPGPWGHLEYYETFLEAPEHLVELMPVPSQQTIWRFIGLSQDDVWNLFLEAGVSQELREELDQRSAWYVSETETHVLPNHRVLMNLSPDSRRQIYATLSRWRENPFHRNPTLVDSGSVQRWLRRADLPENIVTLIARVAYPIETELAFSDLPLILSQLATAAQEQRFLKAVTRTRSLIVRIRLNGEPDLGEVAKYWSSENQFKDSSPLLESVARNRGVDRLDIAHLLPPVPRKHLYTFPSLNSGQSGRYPDSFWSVFNFFEFWPDETPQDTAEIDARLRSSYHPLKEASQFGDVIFLRDTETNRLLHGCVFLADDIVYTKIGPSVFQPWILKRLPDLLRHWSHHHPPAIEAWRPNRISGVDAPPRATRFSSGPLEDESSAIRHLFPAPPSQANE